MKAAIDTCNPGKVFDLTTDLDLIADASAAMTNAARSKPSPK